MRRIKGLELLDKQEGLTLGLNIQTASTSFEWACAANTLR